MYRRTTAHTVPTLRTSRNPAHAFTGGPSPRAGHPEARAHRRNSAKTATLGPATREPGDPVRAEAIELLACCASQPFDFEFTTYDAPGRWGWSARQLAAYTWQWVYDHTVDWRENYAEAEARLREVARER